MWGTTICASTRLSFQYFVLGTTFRASIRTNMFGTTFRVNRCKFVNNEVVTNLMVIDDKNPQWSNRCADARLLIQEFPV